MGDVTEIPRVVHRIWLGGPEPEWQRSFAATWLRPGWELVRWDEQLVEELFPLRNQDLYDRAEELAPGHVGQLRSDVLRYEILHRHGGVYVDADFECLKPIDPLIAGSACFAAWVDDRWINNALMGCVAGHPFVDQLLYNLPGNVQAHRRRRPAVMTGPQFLTGIYHRFPQGVTLIDREHVYPFDWTELDRTRDEFPDAYAIHWWHNQRRERGLPCPA